MKEAEKQLEFIDEMIATAKGNLADGSIYYLIWGWLVLIAAGINYYLLEYVELNNHWVAWPVLMSLGGVLSIVIGIRSSKKARVVSKIDKMIRYLWLGVFITLIVILSAIGVVGPKAIYPVLMALYGLGTFVSGSFVNFKPLKIGAVAAWVCSSIAFYVGFSDQLILISVAIIFSYIIPGHLLAAKK